MDNKDWIQNTAEAYSADKNDQGAFIDGAGALCDEITDWVLTEMDNYTHDSKVTEILKEVLYFVREKFGLTGDIPYA